eukprot:4040247-Alexandrium_andersonii.AAC.1
MADPGNGHWTVVLCEFASDTIVVPSDYNSDPCHFDTFIADLTNELWEYVQHCGCEFVETH